MPNGSYIHQSIDIVTDVLSPVRMSESAPQGRGFQWVGLPMGGADVSTTSDSNIFCLVTKCVKVNRSGNVV